jgi:hypothetical protein
MKILMLLFLLILASCNNSSSSSSSINPISQNQQFNFKKNVVLKRDLVADGEQYKNLVYALKSSPELGVVELNGETGRFNYLSTYAKDDFFSFIVGNDANESQAYRVTLKTQKIDPLFSEQWYIQNTGQSVSMQSNGYIGEDIHLQKYQNRIFGEGVTILLIDQGLEVEHEDLKENILVGESFDFNTKTSRVENLSVSGDHGTSVAGIMVAQMDNGVGIRGIAPKAKIKAFNFLSSDTSDDKLIAVHGLPSEAFDLKFDNIDIINKSFGTNPSQDESLDGLLLQAFQYATENLRNNKGIVFVKAAGNEFDLCGDDNITTCFNVTMEAENNYPYQILVGASDHLGHKTSYSNTGSALWITAPGGGDGLTTPGIVTTDQSGCNRGAGLSLDSSINTDTERNPSCNYYANFNGTSASAPIVSAIVALMLEVNPNLKWHDVKTILAKTARKTSIDEHDLNIQINGEGYIAEYGWQTNTAGFHFSNYYGFGLVDADRAIDLAKNFVPTQGLLTSDWIESLLLNQSVPDFNAEGINSVLDISIDKIIHAVQVKVNIKHPYVGDLALQLTSPSGMKSILLNMNNGFGYDQDLDNYILISNAFLGESTAGLWELKVVDSQNGDEGKLLKWGLNFYYEK